MKKDKIGVVSATTVDLASFRGKRKEKKEKKTTAISVGKVVY